MNNFFSNNYCSNSEFKISYGSEKIISKISVCFVKFELVEIRYFKLSS